MELVTALQSGNLEFLLTGFLLIPLATLVGLASFYWLITRG
jgi:hypothetical protein